MPRDAHEELRTKLNHQQKRKKIPRSQPNQLLRQARRERCWSQADLAERVGVTNETISRWENGVNTPQPEQLKNLCEVFDKTPADLGYPPGPASIKVEETVEVPGAPVEPAFIKQEPPLTWKRPRAITVGVSALMIVLLVLGVVRFAPSILPTNCGGTFFNGTLGSGWEWINPGGKATQRLMSAGLALSAPAHSDLNPAYNFNAPRLLRSITGNFSIETQLVFRPETNFQSAGILLWQDAATFIRFERGFGGRRSGVLFQAWDHGIKPITIASLEQYPTTAETVELRLQRQGDHITTAWREPGQPWQSAGDTLLHFERLLIGVDLLNDFNTLQNTSASYTYFRVVCTQ